MSLDIKRLNDLTSGKTIKRITFDEGGPDNLTLYFTDSTRVRLSTLGGIDIVFPSAVDPTTPAGA